jgi:hypothetical protein
MRPYGSPKWARLGQYHSLWAAPVAGEAKTFGLPMSKCAFRARVGAQRQALRAQSEARPKKKSSCRVQGRGQRQGQVVSVGPKPGAKKAMFQFKRACNSAFSRV